MPEKFKIDIDNENFNNYFLKNVMGMGQEQKESLPDQLLYRVFKNGASVNLKNSAKLSFLSKLFILWRALKKNWFIVVEGSEENGMSIEDFVKLKTAMKKRNFGVEKAEDFTASGTFVTGSKELMDALSYLNALSVSPAYAYLTKIKNAPTSKSAEWKVQMGYICKFLAHYEGMKKKVVMEQRIDMSEILLLLVFHAGKELNGPILLKEFYRYSYHTSKTRIKVSLGILQSLGLISKTGHARTSKFRITPLGTNKIEEIMRKYVINP